MRTTVKIGRHRRYVLVPPLESVTSMTIRGRRLIFDVIGITMEQLKAHRAQYGDMTGMPMYYALAAGAHELHVYPIPSSAIEAEIEYEPLVVRKEI